MRSECRRPAARPRSTRTQTRPQTRRCRAPRRRPRARSCAQGSVKRARPAALLLRASRPAHLSCGADSSGSSRSDCEAARVQVPACVSDTCGACARCRCRRQRARRSLARPSGAPAGWGAPCRAGGRHASPAAARRPDQHPGPALQACSSRGTGRQRPALRRVPARRRGPRPGRPRAARAAAPPRALRRRRPESRRLRLAAARRADPQRSPCACRPARAQAALPRGRAPLRHASARGAVNQLAARGAPKACCDGFTGHA